MSKKTSLPSLLITVACGCLFSACESGPSTWEEEEADYQRNQKIQSYEDQQQQERMDELNYGQPGTPDPVDQAFYE